MQQKIKKGNITDIQSLLKEIISIIRYNTHSVANSMHYKIWLYGSWAKGNALSVSDIDIAVDAGEKLPEDDYFKILREIDNLRTLRKIDFVDMNRVGEGLRNSILETGKILYEI